MEFRKYLVTHTYGDNDSRVSTHGYVIPNSYSHTLSMFKEMLKVARNDFPELKEGYVECRTVVESRWCKKCPCLFFAVEANAVREGWISCGPRLEDVQLS